MRKRSDDLAAEPPVRRALFLAPETPYPMVGGGALRSASVLEYLTRRYAVDAVVFRQPESRDPVIDFPAGMIQDLLVIDLPAHSRNAAARIVRNLRRLSGPIPPMVDRFAGFGDRIAAFLQGRAYDVAVVEHFWCAPYWERIAPHSRTTVLDLHNIESAWHLGCSKISGNLQALAHAEFYSAALALEKLWLRRYSLLLTTSEQDAKRVRALCPDNKIVVYPNTVPLAPRQPLASVQSVVFSGTLDYEPNRSAVRYFRNEIWPDLRQRWPDLKWHLVGRNPEAIDSYIRGDPRIDCSGSVDDAILQLAAAQIAIVPLLSGSGTRLKIIEAWAAGLPVVSTTLGAEGFPVRHGENILLADNPQSFATAISSLLESAALRQQIGQAGRALYEREFTWEAGWRKLDGLFD